MRALRACQLPPPRRSRSTLALLGAVARQQVDVLDRQIELGAFGVMDFQAIVRRAGGMDRLQAGETADAVIDVHDQIAGREAGRLGNEIVGAAHARGAAAPAGRREYPAR